MYIYLFIIIVIIIVVYIILNCSKSSYLKHQVGSNNTENYLARKNEIYVMKEQ